MQARFRLGSKGAARYRQTGGMPTFNERSNRSKIRSTSIDPRNVVASFVTGRTDRWNPPSR